MTVTATNTHFLLKAYKESGEIFIEEAADNLATAIIIALWARGSPSMVSALYLAGIPRTLNWKGSPPQCWVQSD